jgi:hypothetical protein
MPLEGTQGLPRIPLRPPEDEETRALRSAQMLMLKHPVAAQGAFSALVAEGRQYAETAEGRQWRQRLTRSSLLHRARLVWEVSTLWMLEEEPPSVLPSAYLDALFMSASSEELEPLLDRLFREASDGSKPDDP